MKYIFLILLCVALSGCVRCQQKTTYDENKRERLYLQCLELAAKARSGRDYTTNDDEDYDEVISKCARNAEAFSYTGYKRVCSE